MGLFVHDDHHATRTRRMTPTSGERTRRSKHARAALTEIESRARTLEAERDAHHDDVHVLLTAQERAGLRHPVH